MIKNCLDAYERASGQVVNFQKSSISFSSNMPVHLKDELCNFLSVRVTEDHGNYLGLPSLIGKNKKQFFLSLKIRHGIEHKVGEGSCYLEPKKSCCSRLLFKQFPRM